MPPAMTSQYENEFIINRIYQEIFREDLINPNGCSIKGTFFVSHKYTNYSAVQVSLISIAFSGLIG